MKTENKLLSLEDISKLCVEYDDNGNYRFPESPFEGAEVFKHILESVEKGKRPEDTEIYKTYFKYEIGD